MLYLTEEDVQRLLPMPTCIDLMETVFARLGSGEALNHPRRRLILPTKSVLHYLVGSDGKYFGAKVYATNPKSGAHFSVLLYRAEDGAPLALVEANHLGQIRTGAATGFATRKLARPGSRTLCVIGSGFQARTQLEAVLAVAPIEQVRVWSRTEEKRKAFAAECAATFGAKVEATETAEEAVRGADILVTATNAGKPVLESAWVGEGVHINATGSNQARRRELPEELVRRCGLIAVDSVEQARMESGDLLLSLTEEEWSGVRELREVAAGAAARTSAQELTLFKSNGLAVQDIIAAGYVYERAMDAGMGRPVYS
jgi:ornithine cyclodeaminase/alanine dehydrogenase-like protein (mu-crystallin family)